MPQSVTITALADGSFEVELENEASEGMETGAEPPEGTAPDMQEDQSNGEAPQSFASIDEALSAVKEMLSGGPEETNDTPAMDGEEELLQGFRNVRGTPTQQRT